MVCDLMIAAVERRFKSLKAPHRLEWLSMTVELGPCVFA